jgi:hypothetical protein
MTQVKGSTVSFMPFLLGYTYLMRRYLAPVDEEIEYYNSVFKRAFGGKLSEYQGWPTDEIDQKWQDLYSSQSLSATSRLPMGSQSIQDQGTY